MPDRFSKENRWYYKEINGHIKPASRELLEKYSHVPAEDVDAHIIKMRDTLWSQAPYPCIGEFKFLTLHLPSHPLYPKLLPLLHQPPSSTESSQPIPLLDLGCCVAQELRSLAHAGVPSSQLYGTDLNGDFLRTSYALFRDGETFRGTLVAANAFEEGVFEGKWRGWEGKFGVVHAGLFLHLFDWEQQVRVCEKVVRLMSGAVGSLFLGEMVGRERGGKSGSGKQYLHDEGSFARMWEEVAEKTGTKGAWKVEGTFRKRVVKEGEDGKSRGAFFTGEGIGWLVFSVTRI